MIITPYLLLSLLTPEKDLLVSKPVLATRAYLFPVLVNDTTHHPVYNESSWPQKWIVMTLSHLSNGYEGFVFRANLSQRFGNETSSFLLYKIRFLINKRVEEVTWKREIWNSSTSCVKNPNELFNYITFNQYSSYYAVEIILSIIIFVLIILCSLISYKFYKEIN